MPSSSSFKLHRPSTTAVSSSSSSSSSSVAAANHDCGGSCEQSPRRQLTRQRKLRYLNNQDLGFDHLPEKSRSSPTSPEYSTPKSRSPDRGSKSNQWSSSPAAAATPQPLPLPATPAIRGCDSLHKDSNFALPFFSIRKGRNQVATTSAAPSYVNLRHSESEHLWKGKSQVATLPSYSSAPPNSSSCNRQVAFTSAPVNCSSSNRCQGTVSQDVNNSTGGRFNFNLGLNIMSRTTHSNGVSSHHPLSPQRSSSADVDGLSFQVNCSTNGHKGMRHEYESCNVSRSAPTSGFSSPAVSPRRSNARDPYPTFGASQDQCQDPFRLSPSNPARSPGHSPLPSPTSRSPRSTQKISNGNGNGFPFHHRSVTEGSNPERVESGSQVNAHPLPLPPGAVVPPPSPIMHHNAEILSTSSMKGQWQKGKLIGRGTFGSVYLATNRETGALCAMKEVDLIPDDPKSAECIKQLEQEIKVLGTLKHPNIVQYYGSETIDDHFYIYLEYVHPGSIDRYVKDHFGAMTESVVRNFTRHILSGLAFLHSKKTIHRDIKGANLLVDASGVVKLADFGMAKLLNGQSFNLSLKGSPYWMAPEVIRAAMQNNSDPDLYLAVDIWSLGCTIVEMFNGKPPWSDFTGPQAMFKVLNTIPDIPETLSTEGKEFLKFCFRRDPKDRPSASQLLEHPFVRNSHDQNVSHQTQNMSLMNIMDKLHSPRDFFKQKNGRV